MNEFEAMDQAMRAQSTPAVQYWINWMGIVQIASIIFVWKHKLARLVIPAMLGVFIAAYITWITTHNIWLFGIGHFVFWIPLAIIIYRRELSPAVNTGGYLPRLRSPYFIWLSLYFVTIVISLVFDVRDVALVLLGLK